MDLKGKNVLITGASGGIGCATALLLKEKGLNVFGTSRDVEKIKPEIKKKIEFIEMDITDDKSVKQAVRTFLNKSGSPDIIINNIGVPLIGSVEDTSMILVKNVFEINLFGMLRVIKEFIPLMRQKRKGTICNIGSLAGILPTPFLTFYSMTKYAVESLTECLKQELRPFNIKVFCIEPGDTNTEANENAIKIDFEKSPYKSWITRFWQANIKGCQNGPEPEVIAKKIYKVLKKKKPYTRYAAGDLISRMFPFLIRIFNKRLREKAIRLYYDIDFK